MNERTAPATSDCDHQPQGSRPEPVGPNILYVAMDLRIWGSCEFDGLNNGSVGFMSVFEDVMVLKAAYPDAEIMKVTRTRD